MILLQAFIYALIVACALIAHNLILNAPDPSPPVATANPHGEIFDDKLPACMRILKDGVVYISHVETPEERELKLRREREYYAEQKRRDGKFKMCEYYARDRGDSSYCLHPDVWDNSMAYRKRPQLCSYMRTGTCPFGCIGGERAKKGELDSTVFT